MVAPVKKVFYVNDPQVAYWLDQELQKGWGIAYVCPMAEATLVILNDGLPLDRVTRDEIGRIVPVATNAQS